MKKKCLAVWLFGKKALSLHRKNKTYKIMTMLSTIAAQVAAIAFLLIFQKKFGEIKLYMVIVAMLCGLISGWLGIPIAAFVYYVLFIRE